MREDTLLSVSIDGREDIHRRYTEIYLCGFRAEAVYLHTKIHGFQVEAVYLHTKIHGFHSMWCIFTDRVTSLQRYTGGKV